jgi:thiol-disulfide isomerase/thioredoxin
MTGVWIVLGALAVALIFGGYRKLTDGRAKEESKPLQLTAPALGAELGSKATFVQFSATVCAPCRATHRLLSSVVADDPTLAHIDIDAETRLDLVTQFGITRTPSVLLLDEAGVVRHRIIGAARKTEVLGALEAVAPRQAA